MVQDFWEVPVPMMGGSCGEAMEQRPQDKSSSTSSTNHPPHRLITSASFNLPVSLCTVAICCFRFLIFWTLSCGGSQWMAQPL